jgi:drug/metabolite transporter (DMT)-like permease
MLNKMSPFFAILFSFFILNEKIKLPQMAIVIGAFLGSLLIIKPTPAIFQSPEALIGLCGGMAAGLAYTYVRKLGEKGEKGPFIVFVFSAFSCLVTLPYLLFNYHPMAGIQLIYLLLAGLSAAGGQFAITAAYCHAPAREISVFDYTQILFSAILGFFVFGQIPDGASWAGYCVICFMAVLMFFYNNRKKV